MLLIYHFFLLEPCRANSHFPKVRAIPAVDFFWFRISGRYLYYTETNVIFALIILFFNQKFQISLGRHGRSWSHFGQKYLWNTKRNEI